MIGIENNEVLKTLTKTLTFVDADADANAKGSTIALPERCSGELKRHSSLKYLIITIPDAHSNPGVTKIAFPQDCLYMLIMLVSTLT